ncbi:cobalt transport protein CbiN [uncultured Parolsenella sp.]|uniref:energy-coupling factor ABC transporter substrate-binding protein n=1 Tax=uncultured Parolsenella sp. TaxID=2083008 RepID=UPI0027DCC07D|nr:cobalt transport protein CbiN [uncultured Parolsenella sp.]
MADSTSTHTPAHNPEKKSNKGLVIGLLIVAILIAFVPLFVLAPQGMEFGGSDDKGGQLVEQTDPTYEVWATPVLEQILGSELPGETESFLFCVQTGIGVGIVAFVMGRLVERKKWEDGRGKPDEL